MSQLTPQTRRQGPSFSMVFFGVGLAFGVVAYVTYLRPEMRVNAKASLLRRLARSSKNAW